VAYNIPMILLATIGLNVRPRDLWQPMLVAYPTLLIFGALNFACTADSCQLPSVVVSCIGLFIGTNIACFMEYLTAAPAAATLVPVLLILAPGSGAVLSVISRIHLEAGEMTATAASDFWSDLVLEGLAYGLGMFGALQIWSPLLARSRLFRNAAAKFRVQKCLNPEVSIERL